MNDLESAAADLARVTLGMDWDKAQTQAVANALFKHAEQSSPGQLDAALRILVSRLEGSKVEDADGAAVVALSGGTLVETGAAPGLLAEVLLARLPGVLRAARRYADLCLADPRCPKEYPENEALEVLLEVDQRPVTREVFRAHLDGDRAGGAALVNLERWVLPAVAALTRDRECLRRAAKDATLISLADSLADSNAAWLRPLFGVQLDARWLVLCPMESRGFWVTLDGIVSNWDLHALLAAALVPLGIPGRGPGNPPEVITFIRGLSSTSSVENVNGTWNLYDYRAARLDLAKVTVPDPYWVWGEGIPNDVLKVNGLPVLVVGPASYTRSWSLGRTFSALPAQVKLDQELSAREYRSMLESLPAERSA